MLSKTTQEWSEEDEKMRADTLDSLRRYQLSMPNYQVELQMRWLRSLRPQPKPEWPEWSEDDERILKGIIGKIDHDQTYGVSKVEMLSFLKSLRPQPKAEWSEEDEHRRKDAIYFLESAMKHYADTSEIEKTIDWIKSLRPCLSDEEIKKLRSEEYTEGFNDCLLGKQKGWSESDEEMLDSIIKVVCGVGVQPNGLREKQVRFLKSLRPSWKPSEEELVALKRVGGILRDYGHSELAKTIFMIEGKLANLSITDKSTWRPSDEQMKALERAIVRFNSVDDIPILTELRDNLKKL